jgi:hypothetical protein
MRETGDEYSSTTYDIPRPGRDIPLRNQMRAPYPAMTITMCMSIKYNLLVRREKGLRISEQKNSPTLLLSSPCTSISYINKF